MRSSLLVVLFACSLAVGGIFDFPDEESKPKSRAALDSMAAYETAVKNAEDTARKAREKAAAKLKEDLQSARKNAMQAGKLDEANAIQGVIQNMGSPEAAPKELSKKTQHPIAAGKGWQKTIEVKAGQRYLIEADGTWQPGSGPRTAALHADGGHCHGLFGRIGDYIIGVGTKYTLIPERDGALEMNLLGGDVKNDQGSVNVTISTN